LKGEIYLLLKMARRRLVAAQGVISRGYYEIALHYYYLVVFFLMKALVLNEGVVTRKRAGYVAAFHQLYVKTGKAPRSYGRLVNRLGARAIQGVYKYRRISRDDAVKFGRFANELAGFVENKIRG
jgi:uncharacterized protein (UPF0332 family)